MKVVLFVVVLFGATVSSTKAMAIDVGDLYCTDYPYQDEKAIAACQWILDANSPFHKCMSAFDLDRVKEFYSMCLDIFCEKGDDGACQFADNLAEICKAKYDIPISERPEFCGPPPTTTPASYCTDEPGKDENAIEACSWVLDVDSPFHPCMEKLQLSKTKEIYQACLAVYCNKGQTGVCTYSSNVVEICGQNGTDVDGKPDFCQGSGQPSCSEEASKACSWILDAGTSFFYCLTSFGTDKVKAIYKACTDVYCEKGEQGVCQTVNNLVGLCEEQCEMTIWFRPKFCGSFSDAEASYCEGDPLNSDEAKKSCSWLIEEHGAFDLCSHMLGIASDSEQYKSCLTTYCHFGTEGVCHFAANVAGICESSFGFPVGGSLPFC